MSRTLSIDTSDSRGSVVVRADSVRLMQRLHTQPEDYSSWLLPAIEDTVKDAALTFEGIDLLGVSTGPGSFTGVRMGLCVVKALAEVYGIPVVGVSRLEAMARSAPRDGLIAVTYDAHRGQVFGGLYLRVSGRLKPAATEMVISPSDFLVLVQQHPEGRSAQWVSLDPELFTGLPAWPEYASAGVTTARLSPDLANSVGEIAEERAAWGEVDDVATLDANYVRRADAEILWKGPGYRV